MVKQTIQAKTLRQEFDEWVAKPVNAKLDPLTDYQIIINELAPIFENELAPHSKTIQILREGGLDWLLVEGGFPLICNIETDTPTNFDPISDTKWWPAAQFTLGLMAAFSLQPIAFKSENEGALFQNLVAGKHIKSKDRLTGHTDAVAFPFQRKKLDGSKISASPDFVILIGIRNPDEVATWLAPVGKIFSKIFNNPGAYRKQYLSEPIFDIEPQPSFAPDILPKSFILTDNLYGKDADGVSAFRFRNSGISVNNSRNDKSTIESVLDDITKTLTDDLNKQDCEIFEKVVVKPGDVLFVNNRYALHGRGQVTDINNPQIGKETRWLLRTYGYKGDTKGYLVQNGLKHKMLP